MVGWRRDGGVPLPCFAILPYSSPNYKLPCTRGLLPLSCHSSPLLVEPDLHCIQTLSPLGSAAIFALRWLKILNLTHSFVGLWGLMLIIFATEGLCDSQHCPLLNRKELSQLQILGREQGTDSRDYRVIVRS